MDPLLTSDAPTQFVDAQKNQAANGESNGGNVTMNGNGSIRDRAETPGITQNPNGSDSGALGSHLPSKRNASIASKGDKTYFRVGVIFKNDEGETHKVGHEILSISQTRIYNEIIQELEKQFKKAYAAPIESRANIFGLYWNKQMKIIKLKAVWNYGAATDTEWDPRSKGSSAKDMSETVLTPINCENALGCIANRHSDTVLVAIVTDEEKYGGEAKDKEK